MCISLSLSLRMSLSIEALSPARDKDQQLSRQGYIPARDKNQQLLLLLLSFLLITLLFNKCTYENETFIYIIIITIIMVVIKARKESTAIAKQTTARKEDTN